MRIIFYVLVAGIAAAVTFGLAMAIWRLSLRFRLYPKIRARDIHTRPTPRLGGAAMMLGVLAAFGIGAFLPPLRVVYDQPGQILAILAACVLIVLMGIADDLWDLDWMTKLAGQIIAAALIAWQGVQIAAIPLPGVLLIQSPLGSLIVTVLVIVLVMNAINFIDGLDGLVTGIAIIANIVFFIYTYIVSYGPTEQSQYFNIASLITAILLGACIGFLPLNFRRDDAHPAKMFMGDAGALLVGLLMSTAALAVTTNIDPEAYIGDASRLLPGFIPIILPFAVLVIPLLDFGLAVLRRVAAGKSPFSADRMHLHHRLLDMGHSHRHAVLIFYGWTAVVSVGCLLFLILPDWWWAAVATLAGLLICTIVTLAPLSRRKAVEAAVQSARPDATGDLAALDPLDAASDVVAFDDTPSPAAAAAALALRKEPST